MVPSKYGKASGDINDVMEPIQANRGRPAWVPGEYARTDEYKLKRMTMLKLAAVTVWEALP